MRASEYVLFAYFAWTSLLALTLRLSTPIRVRTLLANLLVLVVYLVLFRLRQAAWVGIARDWIPQALIILAYKEMGWFAPASHTNHLEQGWIVWDRIVLDQWHGRAWIEALGALIPFLLELSYVVVYALPPVTMLIVYRLGMQRRADVVLTIYLLGMLLSYGQFPFWPSEPPRAVFPGQDMPNVDTLVRRFSLWIVGSYGIHTSVFPSAHVSGAMAAALAMAYVFPRRRVLILSYFIYAATVAVATVYGRYHYAADALAGIAVGCLAWPLGIWLSRRVDKGG
jgi:membrane-associated phospholipid phosphatase